MSNNEKAIIIGGGISGKLAARVLSDFFKEVVVIERDSEPSGPFTRKGAPQGEHLHALLHAGEYGLEALFPGITQRFYSSGAIKINSTRDLSWFHHGVWKLQYDGGYTTTLQTRPHLEWHIEEYIKKIPNITVHYKHIVENYLFDKQANRITGVKVKNSSAQIQMLKADLIVDASGASSLSTSWLKKHNYSIPEEKVNIGLTYISKFFHLPNQYRNWTIKLVYPNPPQEKIGGTISKVEGNRYVVTLFGYQNIINEKEILKDDSRFLELTKELPTLDIYQEIKNGTSLNKISIYRVPHMIWKRYDKMRELPKGLLLIGDTVCRIDPVFGQGMSIAVLETLALQKLFQNPNYHVDKITAIFPKRTAKIISPIWNMVATEDLRYRNVKEKKSIGLVIQQWYSKKIFQLSAQNQYVYDSFIKVMNLVSPITILFHPKIIKSVIVQSLFKHKHM